MLRSPAFRFASLCIALFLGFDQNWARADANEINPALRTHLWSAEWISAPGVNSDDFLVEHFRKNFDLAAKPTRFLVHVSADRRYRLFVNGVSVSSGPQRSDAMRWRFESVDVAPFLQVGHNTLAAVVWNYGEDHPYALMTVGTGFILQGDSTAERSVDTNKTWKVVKDPAYTALDVDRAKLATFIVVGPGERIDGGAYPWNWQSADYDDSHWATPRLLGRGTPEGVGTDVTRWLAERNLPPMEETRQRLGKIRRSEGIASAENFLSGNSPVVVPANTKATLLFDQGFETNAYPHLLLSHGRGAVVTATYAEALIDEQGKKGPRNAIEGRHIIGRQDAFTSDGGVGRDFTTLTFRTFRYLQLEIATRDEPLTLEDFYGVFTGYPFEEKASFSSDDSSLSAIWHTGWRTARLCAFETYTDCPYYEQLQYVGDTRIQALVSLYVSGDDRLMRNAIELFDRSRLPNGLTQSRYPSTSPQIIPPFSLFWVQMVHDYWSQRHDPAFVQARLDGVEDVLRWFEERLDPQTHLLGPLPYWCFEDWPDAWPWIDDAHPGGQAPGAQIGGSAIISLQLAWTLEDAADLCDRFDRREQSFHYRQLAASLREATVRLCWDEQRGVFADTPAKKTFSQHVNAFAVLAGAISGDPARELMKRVLHDPSLTPCTLYFRFYLLRAMKKVGFGDEYVNQLGPWRAMVANGLSTFAERPDPTRSDCHAWSASPTYELLATVCGIAAGSPEFASVRIDPHLGPLTFVTGVVPHPAGLIKVQLKRVGTKIQGEIELPPGIPGEFAWRGKLISLHGGKQHVELD